MKFDVSLRPMFSCSSHGILVLFCRTHACRALVDVKLEQAKTLMRGINLAMGILMPEGICPTSRVFPRCVSVLANMGWMPSTDSCVRGIR